MATVTGKLKHLPAPDPLGPNPDPWADFREIEVLGLEWTQHYKHSLGKYSRFFLELENRRFFATRCPKCQKVWTPPRPVCPDDLTITGWVELSGRGQVVSFSVLHYAPAMLSFLKTPYVLAYVKMEGADTLFAHLLQNFGDLSQIRHGMPVRVVYNNGPVDHPIMLMAFEPADS
ncbi:MAG: Zn-ribbon domain-containing OB-fold protein [Chloroflexi bacterium]|nr:MAG: Zn-ribbon domain-containing OB-fold protein [Chloroflexota bacterium]